MTRVHRDGLTLTEVLVALFVMALGLIALLTLFPLGAIQIAQALKDDRTSQTARFGDSWMRMYWRHQVVEPMQANGQPNDPFIFAMDDPNLMNRRLPTSVELGLLPSNVTPPVDLRVNVYLTPQQFRTPILGGTPTAVAQTANSVINSVTLLREIYFGAPTITGPDSTYQNMTWLSPFAGNPSGGNQMFFTIGGQRQKTPSFPVMVDPLGLCGRNQSAPEQFYVSMGTNFGQPSIFGVDPSQLVPLSIPRRTLFSLSGASRSPLSQSLSFQACALTDDLTFEPNGAPNAAVLARQGRYAWAAMLQRMDNSDPTTTNMKILVFDSRPAFAIDGGDEVTLTGPTAWDGNNPNTPQQLTLFVGQRTINLLVPVRGAEQVPLIRKGGWIMDSTMDNTITTSNTNSTTNPSITGIRNANFYRITGLTQFDPVTPGLPGDPAGQAYIPYTIEIDPPILPLHESVVIGTSNPQQTRLNATYNAQLTVFSMLAEVFDRQPLTRDPVQY